MSMADMQELMYENRTLSFKLFKLVGFRLKKTERRLESLVFKDTRTRVVEFIRELAEEKGRKSRLRNLGSQLLHPPRHCQPDWHFPANGNHGSQRTERTRTSCNSTASVS